MPDIYEVAKQMAVLLEESKPVFQKLRDDAETLHDSPGEMYLDYSLYECMQTLNKSVERIDKQLSLFAELEGNMESKNEDVMGRR